MKNLTIMPPYVTEAHRELLSNAENALDVYSNVLLERIKSDLFGVSGSTDTLDAEPSPSEVWKAERDFHEDPVRQILIKKLGHIKMLVERPRFLVVNT